MNAEIHTPKKLLTDVNMFRAVGLYLNALFPFIMPLKSYLNGNIFRGAVLFIKDYISYSRAEKNSASGFPPSFKYSFPIFVERYEEAGNILRHYFWQDMWAARKVYESRVAKHYDIGSRLDGFIGHCLCFCEVVMLDIRPLPTPVKSLSFVQANCMSMAHIESGSIESLSTLHAVEHFGLGRYGDPIEPRGHEMAIREIQRVVKSGASIYFSVPIGIQRVEFNAHRVFSPKTVLKLFDLSELVEFSVVDDQNKFYQGVSPDDFSNLNYGCGLFHFRKK